VGSVILGRVPLTLETTPRLAARVSRLGIMSPGRLIAGSTFSAAAITVGRDVKLARICFTLLSSTLGMVNRGKDRLAEGLSSAVAKSASTTDGNVKPGTRALIAASTKVRQCH
jgi:hypothetical protein